jgi:hypothetical protein
LSLLIIVTAVVWFGGYLNMASLARLDPWVAALLGIFAYITGTMLWRIWRLDEKSGTGFRYASREARFDVDITLIDHLGGKITIGQTTREPARDIPPALQRIILVVVCLLIGLVAFNNRSFALLKELPERVRLGSVRFCDEPGQEEKTRGPEAQGCELVRRAYLLGYAESLGPCEPEAGDESEQICKLRQRDEPYLHYAWRLLVDRTRPVLDLLSADAFGEFKDRFGAQLDHLGALYDVLRQAIANLPRASHHLWTNLPAPRPGMLGRIKDAVAPGHCLAQTAPVGERWSMAAGAPTASELLERVFGQLLFDPRYLPIVGVCGEYTIHWDAPADACWRLAQRPKEFLAETGALSPVLQVLERHKRERELGEIFGDRAPGEPRVVEQLVSFQCFMSESTATTPGKVYSFTLEGHRFLASEARFTPSDRERRMPVELAQRLASLLARGFYYGRHLSRASPTQSEEDLSLDELLAGGDFRLARLEYLRDADLFLAPEALGERTDLYEVYPYHLHLRSFVEVFRRQYQQQRDRL